MELALNDVIKHSKTGGLYRITGFSSFQCSTERSVDNKLNVHYQDVYGNPYTRLESEFDGRFEMVTKYPGEPYKTKEEKIVKMLNDTLAVVPLKYKDLSTFFPSTAVKLLDVEKNHPQLGVVARGGANSGYGVSILSLIASITDVALDGKRLGVKIDDEKNIICFDYY